MSSEISFIPGSKWLSYKIYCGPGYSNTLLIQTLTPFVNAFLDNKKVLHWFFIRYNDPDHHIRFRMFCKDAASISDVFMSFESAIQPLARLGYVSDVQLVMYKRELARYGSKNLDHIERFWSKESSLLINLLTETKTTQDYLCEILFLAHGYLKAFSKNDNQLLAYANQSYNAFSAEFELQKKQKKQLSEKYRIIKSKLSTILTADMTSSKVAEVFNVHFLELKKCNTALSLKKTPNVWSSIVHMLVNRAFEKSQREMELIIYHHLSTYYRTQISRFGKI